MIEIEKFPDEKIFCPACGTAIFDFDKFSPTFGDQITDCPHLHLAGSNEGEEIDKNGWQGQWEAAYPNEEITFFEYLAKTLDDHYVCFYHYPMAPSTVSGHTLFKFEVSGASS